MGQGKESVGEESGCLGLGLLMTLLIASDNANASKPKDILIFP